MKNSLLLMHQSELLISFHSGKITILKNRCGESKDVDLSELLEVMMPFVKGFAPILKDCIHKIKTFKLFI